jgi:pSer/pThr/pTyr-binding forkhead associated (FHA) protein
MPMARLVCTYGSDETKVFSLKEGVNRVGRGPDAQIRLNDKACSRSHAEVFRKGDYVSLEDRGSRHGTFVNGRRVAHRVKLHVGDRLDIGHTVLKLAEGESETPDRATADLPTASGQTSTQELSEQLLAAARDLRERNRKPRISLLQRLFHGQDGEEP